MRRVISLILLLGGVGCIALGVWVIFATTPVYAQDNAPEEADYVGSGDCQDCHRNLVRDHSATPHGLALQETDRSKDAILGDFSQGADVRSVQFPGEAEPRPFEANDIAYAVGAGRHMQRYLYEVGERQYAVFPAEWDTVAQVWRPYTLGASWPDDPAYDWTQNCAGCHTTGLDLERGRWEDDGVQCEACHGPGSNHVEIADDAGGNPSDSELDEIHAAIQVTPDAQVCAQCHSQGTEPGGHPYPVSYRPGGDLLQEGVFTLVTEDDPAFWWATGHGRANNMQFNEWLNSAHATSLETLKGSTSAQDECLTCHSGDYLFMERILELYEDEDLTGDPPEAVTLETAQMGLTCVTCHMGHPDDPTEYNLVDTAYGLCTTCHQNTSLIEPLHHPVLEMFEGRTVIEGIEGVASAHFSAEDGPRCVTCHMPSVPVGNITLASHTWRPVIPGEEADSPPDSCFGCHEDLTTADLQSLIEDTQKSIRERLSIGWARVASVTAPEGGTDAAGLYAEAVAALTFVQNDQSMGVHNYAYADQLLKAASERLARLSVPSANLQPTEGPAPTATPSAPQPVTISIEQEVPTGFRPMTIILMTAVVLILLIGSLLIMRLSRRQEGNP
ncbi:MAG: hypothetical protein JNM70_05215 [Anaerolineae bacterium]|nr:hypothetical protein [Anaerolineae bacterium]